MKTLKGKVEFQNLEGGLFHLVTPEGKYLLQGGSDDLYEDGVEVEVQGEVIEDAMGIGMTGAPVFQVQSFRRL